MIEFVNTIQFSCG